MRAKVSAEEEQIWEKRYLEGESCRKISQDFPQYHESTISRHIKKMGISRGRGHSKEKNELKPVILKEYTEDKYATCSSLSRKYGISDRTISVWLKDNGIKIKQEQGYITHCDTKYFEQIDTPNKAYLLGFITADGAVVNTSCSIEVHSSDKEVLEFAKTEINPDATITICKYKNKDNVRVSFNSKKICSDLSKYGVVQNKSKIIKEVPTDLIAKELLPFYFRGLIDGDGCIHKDGKVSIYSGSEDYIKSVQSVLVNEAGVKQLGIYHGTTYFISWGGKKDKEKLFHYLYDNLESTFYFKRKYQRLFNSLYDNTEVTEQIAQGHSVPQSVGSE